jgi:hypothetical protein
MITISNRMSDRGFDIILMDAAGSRKKEKDLR